MPTRNTATSYGSVTKFFHWTIALMILSMFPLGWIASELAHRIEAPDIQTTDAILEWAKILFSIHKTLGVTIFALAVLRILWAISQPKPALLNGDRPMEARLAETVHWLLYGSLVLVPLSGWVHHAATTGFAPIWWPFGQGLPFVPKDPAVAEVTGALHFILQWVLAGSVALHIAGALKHHVIDRDATLRRMLPGHQTALPTEAQPGHALPILAALAVWAAAIGLGGAAGWLTVPEAARAEALADVPSEWQVTEGNLGITIVQNGTDVTGSFADWTAQIDYADTPDADGRHGAVTVTIAIQSLTLGSVTGQAMGADFFAAEEFPTAVFEATLINEDGLIADGTLRIRDETLPVRMPVELAVEGDTANAAGALTVNRMNFGIGTDTKDESSLAYEVRIDWALTAVRGGGADVPNAE
ncbi:cytochrome b/b6 domain-containing protein [Roseovarius nanhaiticus]|uniref:cytochrome b/b6 domain-containing protein n=1 Tax=Roseovarius nanhaiticus TaxID=573024 RepID=UPI002492F237|nr:cytochrome b/b6 domain-containing protein [Roseovarius nanhaiticus]